MTIRNITMQDYERLIVFWGENYFVNDMDSKDRFKLFLDKNPKLSFLVEEYGEIFGTALGSFDGRRGYIQKVVTKKDIRQKGIGKQLVDKIVHALKALGVTYVPIAVDKDTVLFYEKCGFKITNAVAMNMSFSKDKAYKEYIQKK